MKITIVSIIMPPYLAMKDETFKYVFIYIFFQVKIFKIVVK